MGIRKFSPRSLKNTYGKYFFCVVFELDPLSGVFLLPDGSSVPEELIENKIMVLNSVKNELALLKNSTKEKHQGSSRKVLISDHLTFR